MMCENPFSEGVTSINAEHTLAIHKKPPSHRVGDHLQASDALTKEHDSTPY